MSVFEEIKIAIEQAIAYEKGELVLQSTLSEEEIKENFKNLAK